MQGRGKWNAPSQERHAALAPYLLQLSKQYGDAFEPIPGRLAIGGRTLTLENWERETLKDSLSGMARTPWAPLIAEGVAYQLKCLHLFETVTANRLDDEKAVERLIVDGAVGVALLQELQEIIDQYLLEGHTTEARRFEAFRHKIDLSVSRLKELLGEELFTRVENRSSGMVNGSAASMVPRAGDQVPEDEPDDSRLDRLAVRRKLMLFGVALAVWAALSLPSLLKPTPTVLQQVDFADIPGITAITARPPSVYATVETRHWNRLDSEQQLQLLDRVGAVASQAGYRGAHLRRSDGPAVGLWLKDKGTSLLGP